MSNATSTGPAPTLFAVICGTVVMVALAMSGLSLLVSIIGGLVAISVVFTLRKRARPVTPERPTAPVTAAPKVPVAPVSAGPSVPDTRAAAAAPTKAPIIASSQLPGEDELATRKGDWRYAAGPLEQPGPVADTAPGGAVIASSQLQGEQELAARRGAWTYAG